MCPNEEQWWRRQQADEAWRRRQSEDYDMDNQRPAAPAVSLPMNRPSGSSIVTLPSKSNVWQRNHSLQVPQPTVSAPAASWRGLASGHPIGNIIYQSLQRPKLLRGGEWQLSVANNLMAAGLGTMALVTWNWRLLLGAAFFAWPVQWLIRMLGRHDPQFWQIYFRTRKRPLIREAYGRPSDRAVPAPRLLPKLRKFVV